MRLWVIFASIALTVFATCACLAFILDRFVSQNNLRSAILLFVGVYGNVPVGIYLDRRFRRRHLRRRVTLRHVADGTPYFMFTFTQEEPKDDVGLIQFVKRVERWKMDPTAEPVDKFECFVFEVIAAIKRIRGTDLDLATSIKNAPK
jgi:hypothetical protein